MTLRSTVGDRRSFPFPPLCTLCRIYIPALHGRRGFDSAVLYAFQVVMKLRLASLLYTRSVLFLLSNNVGHVARLNFGAQRAQQFYTRPEFESWPCYFCLFLFPLCLFVSLMLVSWGGCDKIYLVVIARIKLLGLMRGGVYILVNSLIFGTSIRWFSGNFRTCAFPGLVHV